MRGTQIVENLSMDSLTLSKFRGVFASDKLPVHVPVDQFCICNTDTWKNEGKHWILIYFPPEGVTEFFDPLGNRPSAEFVRFMGDTYLYNTKRYQPLNSNTCAYYCLFFAFMKSRGLKYQSILDLMGTEKIVVRFVLNL